MVQIKNIIEERRPTQDQAAKLVGVRQPRVSALFTGRIDDFTIDMLVKWLNRLGKQVIVTVKDKPDVACSHQPVLE
jgi:predicted XRE-type DNA-binding protein